jgi:hypothetical protein
MAGCSLHWLTDGVLVFRIQVEWRSGVGYPTEEERQQGASVADSHTSSTPLTAVCWLSLSC